MPKKETMKEKIARLEDENKQLKEKIDHYIKLINDADNRIAELESVHDENFQKSSHYKQMLRDIETQTMWADIYKKRLDRSLNTQAQQAEKLERLQKLIVEQSSKNPRGAGRKPVLSDDDRDTVRILHERGNSMRMIAKEMGCSVATISNVLNASRIKK